MVAWFVPIKKKRIPEESPTNSVVLFNMFNQHGSTCLALSDKNKSTNFFCPKRNKTKNKSWRLILNAWQSASCSILACRQTCNRWSSSLGNINIPKQSQKQTTDMLYSSWIRRDKSFISLAEKGIFAHMRFVLTPYFHSLYSWRVQTCDVEL